MIEVYYWPTPTARRSPSCWRNVALPTKLPPVNIQRGDQFAKDFLRMNPNHRMPAIVDPCAPWWRTGHQHLRVWRHHDVHCRKSRPVWPQDVATNTRSLSG